LFDVELALTPGTGQVDMLNDEPRVENAAERETFDGPIRFVEPGD
jgi:hypothetical protein